MWTIINFHESYTSFVICILIIECILTGVTLKTHFKNFLLTFILPKIWWIKHIRYIPLKYFEEYFIKINWYNNCNNVELLGGCGVRNIFSTRVMTPKEYAKDAFRTRLCLILKKVFPGRVWHDYKLKSSMIQMFTLWIIICTLHMHAHYSI